MKDKLLAIPQSERITSLLERQQEPKISDILGILTPEEQVLMMPVLKTQGSSESPIAVDLNNYRIYMQAADQGTLETELVQTEGNGLYVWGTIRNQSRNPVRADHLLCLVPDESLNASPIDPRATRQVALRMHEHGVISDEVLEEVERILQQSNTTHAVGVDYKEKYLSITRDYAAFRLLYSSALIFLLLRINNDDMPNQLLVMKQLALAAQTLVALHAGYLGFNAQNQLANLRKKQQKPN